MITECTAGARKARSRGGTAHLHCSRHSAIARPASGKIAASNSLCFIVIIHIVMCVTPIY